MSFKNSRVLITGGAGFIGSNLALRLLGEGAEVTVVDSFVEGCGGNLFNLEPYLNKISLEKIDLGRTEALLPLIEGRDFIFNLAGNVSHQDSMSNPLEDLANNSVAHLKFLDLCQKHNNQAVILYSSTRQLYGMPYYLPVDEKHPIHPVDINGIHKFAGESYHTLFAKVYGLKTVSLRLTNTFGPRQLIRHSRQGFVGWFVNRAVTGHPIQIFGDGQQLRDFNDVDDCVEAMLRAVQTPACFGEIFNLSGERASLDTIAKYILEAVGSGKLEFVPFPPEKKKIDIGDYYGNSEKFLKASGWQPRNSIKSGLRKMVDYYLENKAKYL